MSVSVSRSLAYVEQGRSTCNVSRSLSVELFCFAACVCHVCLFRFLARSLTSSKDDRPAMSVALSPSSFFASQRVSVSAPNRRESCRLLANSLAKSIEHHRENRPKIDHRRRLGAPKIDSKSLPGPSRDTPWRPRASRRRLGSVSGASWSVPGALRECPEGHQERPGTPERAPWSAWERAEATKIDAKSRPGTKNSSCLGTVHSQTDFRSIFARFSIDFRMFAQGVRGALSRRTSIDFRFEHAKPDPHETLPIAMNSRVGPFEASRLTRAREP